MEDNIKDDTGKGERQRNMEGRILKWQVEEKKENAKKILRMTCNIRGVDFVQYLSNYPLTQDDNFVLPSKSQLSISLWSWNLPLDAIH